MMRKRLTYAARVITARCQVLRVLLSQVDLPWCRLLRKDLIYMHTHYLDDVRHACKIHITQNCIESPEAWLEAMCHSGWNEAVSKVFFVESILDKAAVGPGTVLGHSCHVCNPVQVFATSRALESHQRSKHGVRNFMKSYIDGSGRCPSCKTQFKARVSLLNHVNDRRRPKCKEFILEQCQPLEPSTVSELDANDNELRRAARRAGRSHHIVTAPATSQDGRVVGRASM